MTKFQAKHQELHRAVSRLVDRLELIGNSEEYRSVFAMAQIHGTPYNGPTYDKELSTVKKLLVVPKKGRRDREGG